MPLQGPMIIHCKMAYELAVECHCEVMTTRLNDECVPVADWSRGVLQSWRLLIDGTG